MIELVGIPSKNVSTVWPLVEEWINEACKINPYELSPQAILNDCTSGSKQLWLAWEKDEKLAYAVAVTSVRLGANNKKLAIGHIVTGKEHHRWAHLWKEMLDLAKANGCEQFIALARPGWKKTLEQSGARTRHVEYVWELD